MGRKFLPVLGVTPMPPFVVFSVGIVLKDTDEAACTPVESKITVSKLGVNKTERNYLIQSLPQYTFSLTTQLYLQMGEEKKKKKVVKRCIQNVWKCKVQDTADVLGNCSQQEFPTPQSQTVTWRCGGCSDTSESMRSCWCIEIVQSTTTHLNLCSLILGCGISNLRWI